jgi:NAD(P)H-hydrate epimerase
MAAMDLPLLTREQVRSVDRLAVDDYGMNGLVLMENAGRGAAELLLAEAPAGKVVICSGGGNNGGDGFVIARHLENAGVSVEVLLFADPDSLRGDAAANWRILEAAETPRTVIDPGETEEAASALTAKIEPKLADAQWIVDALLGTGTRGAAREPLATVIRCINAAGKRVLAVDLPSGLDCDTGTAEGDCVRAALTATFVAEKVGFRNAAAAEFLGRVQIVEIGVPVRLLRDVAGGSTAGE